jgi:hypothetical protein
MIAAASGPAVSVAAGIAAETYYKDAYDEASRLSQEHDWSKLYDLMDDLAEWWGKHWKSTLASELLSGQINPNRYPQLNVDCLAKHPLYKNIKPKCNAVWSNARVWRPAPVDPLALDLDGDGLETVGIDSYNTVLFDHDGDGVKTGTGWVKGDDAFLALDRNGNGVIDCGRELFGVDTVLTNGQRAESGFAALADLDSNGDGEIDAQDETFDQLRLWRDLDQDGVSDEGELQSLADAGIARIGLSNTVTHQNLAGGNVLTAQGTYPAATARPAPPANSPPPAASAISTLPKTPSTANSPTKSRSPTPPVFTTVGRRFACPTLRPGYAC